MSFTDGKQRIATEKDLNTLWGGRVNGFRCMMCGYKFKVGDKWRWVYTNDMYGSSGNPIVCERCDGTDKEVRRRWQRKWEEARTRFWWFIER